MTEYDDDKAKLERIKDEIMRKYAKGFGLEALEENAPDGMIIGPRTQEQLEQILKDLAEHDNDDDEEEDDQQTGNH